ncbi:MAG TPA: hypothetical protein VF477_12565 [Mycobacterium sp.]
MTVNWWLVGLAFALGLVITLAFMVRRVERGGAAAASGVVAAKLVDTESESETEEAGPHGPGSAKPGAAGSGPEGWTVKGNEDSKLYHSPESPSYGRTIAEVWFRDVETAEAAGFNRWDSGKSQRGK